MDRDLQHLALQGRVRFHGQTRFDEHHIDRWSAIYIANNLHARGVPYECFLQHPEAFLLANVFDAGPAPAEGFEPLLPAQQRVADRIEQDLLIREVAERHVRQLERECPDARLCDGRFREPLHHRSHPRKARRVIGQC